MKHIAIIPARSGSKGLPDKNIKTLGGKPLLAWSIDAATQSGLFDIVHVSTDSEYYAEIARQYGADVPFLRSAENSSDKASSWDTVIEVLERYKTIGHSFDIFTLLQPTSPLRIAEDIQEAHRIFWGKAAKTVVAVCEAEHSPLWCNTLPEDGCMNGFIQMTAGVPRQALRQYYRINGAIYMMFVEHLKTKKALVYDEDCFAYVMPHERSVDIDNYLDFMIAETIMQSGKIGS